MPMMTVTSGGCRLNGRVDGPNTAPALLFLNALGSTAEQLWKFQAPVFTRAGYRVVRYDTRGHGRSGIPSVESSIDQLGRDAIAVLDALGVERAHVCGSSLGGLTAMWL